MMRLGKARHGRHNPEGMIPCSNSTDVFGGGQQTALIGRSGCGVFPLYLIMILLGSLFLAGGHTAIAADAKLSPKIAVTGSYDDNILLTPENEVSSSIVMVSPGVELDYKTLLSDLTLSADWHVLSYLEESDLNRTNQYYRLRGDRRLKERWSTFADAKFYKDSTLHTYLEETGRVIDRVERDYLEAGGGLGYDLTTLSSIVADYKFQTADYDSDRYSDYDNHNVRLYYAHRLKNERDTLSLGPSYYHRTNDLNEVDSYSLDLGWDRKWSTTTSSRASIGARYSQIRRDRDDDDDSEDDSLGVKANLDITSKGLASTTTFRYFHDIRTTGDGNEINVDNFHLAYRRFLTERFGAGINSRLVFSYKLFDEQADVNDERYFWVEPHLFYRLTQDLDLSLGYRYHNNVEFTDEEDITSEQNVVWLQLSYVLPIQL